MRLLFDCDTIIYKGLYAVDGYYGGLRACDNIVYRVLDKWGEGWEPSFFLSGPDNFRKKIYPLYKANRVNRPQYLHDARKYFMKYWGAVFSVGLEADDMLAMNYGEDSVLVVQDKDYYQLDGATLYDPFKDVVTKIDDGAFFFFRQMLTGDKSDNIPGLKNPAKSHFKEPPNFTDVTATELLNSKQNFKEAVQQLYKDQFGDDWQSIYDRNAQLLFLKRSLNCNYNDYY